MEEVHSAPTQSNFTASLMAISTLCFISALGITIELYQEQIEAIEQTRAFSSLSVFGLIVVAYIATSTYFKGSD